MIINTIEVVALVPRKGLCVTPSSSVPYSQPHADGSILIQTRVCTVATENVQKSVQSFEAELSDTGSKMSTLKEVLVSAMRQSLCLHGVDSTF